MAQKLLPIRALAGTFLLTLCWSPATLSQTTITFDDQGYSDGQIVSAPETISAGGISLVFDEPNTGAIPDFEYRTLANGYLNYHAVGQLEITTADGGEIDASSIDLVFIAPPGSGETASDVTVTGFADGNQVAVLPAFSLSVANQFQSVNLQNLTGVDRIVIDVGNATNGLTGRFIGFDNFRFQPSSLPVELVSFDAVADGNDVLLRWSTASELNNSGFWVEQKTAESFEALTFVEGHGTTLEAQQYQFRAEDLEPGQYTFRLKQVDYDGAFAYGPEVNVSVDLLEDFRLSSAYPNPFNPRAQFELMLAREQQVRVEMVDPLGRVVKVMHDGPLEAQAQHRFTLDGTGLPSGLYLYRVVGEDFRQSRTVVLLK